MSRLGGVTRAAVAVAAVGAASFAWGSLVERRLYTLRQVEVPVLPAGAKPLRILHLSDLHMAPWQHDKQRWLRRLARLKPDLVIDTGDNLGHADGVAGVDAALRPFAGVPGVFVWGSNDYYGPSFKNPLRYFRGPSRMQERPSNLDLAGLRESLEGLGWTDLDNTATALEIGGVRLELFGVDDPHRNFDRLDLMAGALDELRGSTDAASAPQLRIGVAHAPYRRVLDDFVTQGADLILAGHTHGGQVTVPFYGALVTNCDIPRRQVKGLSRWAHAGRRSWLNVSAGLGTSIYAPVRFACRPEATLLTLVPAGR